MSAGNVIITKTVNKVSFSVDQGSYNKAKKQIQSVGKDWDKVSDKMAKATKAAAIPKGADRLRAAKASKERIQQAKAEAAANKIARKEEQARNRERAAAARQMKRQQTMLDKMNARRIRFEGVYNQTKGAMNYTQRSQFKGQLFDIQKQYAAGTLGAQAYTAKLGELQKQMKATAKQSRVAYAPPMVGGGINGITSGMAQVGAGVGMLAAGRSLMKTGVDFQGIHSILKMTEKDEAGAEQSMNYLMGLSERLGVNMVDLADQYAKMNLSRGTLSKETVQEAVTGIQEYGTALHLDQQRMGLANFAIQQMFGKNKVQGQELNQQLAESMPGAKQAFLKAWQDATGNVNLTQGMFDADMQKGLITMDKIAPHLGKAFGDMARKGDALDFALKGINAQYNRMINAWAKFKNSIFESKLGDQMGETFNTIARGLDNMADTMNGPIGNALAGLLEGFTDIGAVIYNSFVFADGVIRDYLQKWGVEAGDIDKMFNWAGWIAGALFFGSSLLRVTSILSKLTGMTGAVRALGAALGEAGLIGGTAGAAGKAAKKGPRGVGAGGAAGAATTGKTLSTLGKLGKWLGPVGTLYTGYEVGKSQFGDQSENVNEARADNKRPRGFLEGAAQSAGLNQLSQMMYPPESVGTPYAGKPTITLDAANWMMNDYRVPGGADKPQEVNGNIKVDVNINDSKLMGIIDAQIEAEGDRQLNMMIQGGQ
ncbi:tape measure protein [Serratia quinivorans]|uniref:tape measure protein n=1 Tax=Serratia quinivorans TaxID=137545 RepID=UPI00217AA453|nr:tape measure protein [Serratia quinivorans]CAI0894949.1 tape measure domain [Serratia quinivorans]